MKPSTQYIWYFITILEKATKATLSLVRQSNIDTFIAVFIGINHLFLLLVSIPLNKY